MTGSDEATDKSFVQTERVDFWDYDLLAPLFDGSLASLDELNEPGADRDDVLARVREDGPRRDEIIAEYDRRIDAAWEQFGNQETDLDRYDTDREDRDEIDQLGDRFAHLSSDYSELEDLYGELRNAGRFEARLDADAIARMQRTKIAFQIIAWHGAAGEPYALPEGALPRKPASAVQPFAREILETAYALAAAHDYGLHIEEPSHFCHRCTPEPSLAFLALEAQRPRDLSGMKARADRDVETVQRSITEARGTAGVSDLMRQLEERPRSIAGLIPSKGVTVLAGRNSSLKTFVGLWLAGQVIADDGRVQFIAGEPGTLGVRLLALAEQLDLPIADVARRISIVTTVPDLHAGGEEYQDVLDRQERERPDLIVIDHLGKVSGDADQDKAGPMGQIMGRVEELARAADGAAVLIAHTGQDARRGVRGSSAVQDRADMVLHAKRAGNFGLSSTVTVEKNRDGADGHQVRFTASVTTPEGAPTDPDTGQPFTTLALEFSGNVTADDAEEDQPVEQATESDTNSVLDAVEELYDGVGVSAGEVATALERSGHPLADRTLRRRLGELVEVGEIEKTGTGKGTRYAPPRGV